MSVWLINSSANDGPLRVTILSVLRNSSSQLTIITPSLRIPFERFTNNVLEENESFNLDILSLIIEEGNAIKTTSAKLKIFLSEVAFILSFSLLFGKYLLFLLT